MQDAERFVIESRRSLVAGERARLAIAEAATGDLLGSVSLDLFAGRQAAEIGYWVKKEARRRGVALAAARLLIRWAFEEVGLERLEILTYPGNAASQALADKLGFRREGLLRGFLAVEPGKDRAGRAEPLPDGSLPPRDDQVQFSLTQRRLGGLSEDRAEAARATRRAPPGTTKEPPGPTAGGSFGPLTRAPRYRYSGSSRCEVTALYAFRSSAQAVARSAFFILCLRVSAAPSEAGRTPRREHRRGGGTIPLPGR